jgi:hypothetical protein
MCHECAISLTLSAHRSSICTNTLQMSDMGALPYMVQKAIRSGRSTYRSVCTVYGSPIGIRAMRGDIALRNGSLLRRTSLDRVRHDGRNKARRPRST